MVTITFEILMILLLILLNGLLAMAEFAIVASRKGRLQELARRGERGAKAALELARNPADFLSTVQIGITLVGVMAGAFGGATIAEALEAAFQEVPFLAGYSEGLAVGIVVVIITGLSLVFGELAPKRLALNKPESLATALAPTMKGLARLASPLVSLLGRITDGLLSILRQETPQDAPVTEEEIRTLIAEATKTGEIREVEEDLVSGVFRLGDRRVGSLITQRTEIEWLDLEDTLEANLHKVARTEHSALPVAQDSLDNVVGILSVKDLLSRCLEGIPYRLEEIMHPAIFVPENTAALEVLEVFKASRPHLVLVIDEYGGVQGLLTIHDILEAIVGDFQFTGRPSEEQRIYRRADGSWLVDGMSPVDEFMETFQISEMPGFDRGHYETMGGFALSRLGKIPTLGDRFEWGGMQFEIVDMDGLRVDKILVKKSGGTPLSIENL